MSTDDVNERARLADDINVAKKDHYTTVEGKDVKLRSIKLGGALKLLSAVRTLDVSMIPNGMQVADFLTSEQLAEIRLIPDRLDKAQRMGEFLDALTPEQKYLLKESTKRVKESIFKFVCESEPILPIVLESITDLDIDTIRDLDLVDTVKILDKGLALTDWDALFEAGRSFFPRLGELVTAAKRKPGNQAADRRDTASAG